MWKDYSASYVKSNRTSSISIMAAALISTLFLSVLCSLFYNFWIYEVEQIVLEEGDWQGRIIGNINEDDIAVIQNFANVESVVINEKMSEEQKTAVDIYFYNMRTIFEDMPFIVNKLGLEEESASYHLLLLSSYFIHDPLDEQPPLLMAFYLAVLVMVSFSLVLIIRNSFAVSMRARVHQFGIFSSIGATPKQIRTCLIQEAAVLCAVPILCGSLLGIAVSAGVMQAANIIAADAAGRHEAAFMYHPFIFVITILVSVLTVLFSVWIPARKLSRLTPLEAIWDTEALSLKRKKNPRILSRLFGMEGELAGNALKAQRKALRTSSLSLTLSFLGFTIVLCFFALTDLSTKYTYFDRYQDVWDEMVTIKDTKIEDFKWTEKLRGLTGVDDLVVFQKAESMVSVPKDRQSNELAALGGLKAVAGDSVSEHEGLWQVPVLREEYEDYALVQFVPLSLWQSMSEQIEGTRTDTCIRILSKDGASLAELNQLEKNISQQIGEAYEFESENRIQEKITNDKMITGYKLIIGSFCFLLALIGIANVFSNTLGFLHQRKREFAQYMSVGLTPEGMRKMFFIEALVIAGRPVLITLPITLLFEVFLAKASHLKWMEVLPQFPAVPIAGFSLIIFGFVALAYYMGGRRLLQSDLSEALRNDLLA